MQQKQLELTLTKKAEYLQLYGGTAVKDDNGNLKRTKTGEISRSSNLNSTDKEVLKTVFGGLAKSIVTGEEYEGVRKITSIDADREYILEQFKNVYNIINVDASRTLLLLNYNN